MVVDSRSGRVTVVCHCLLNANSRLAGIASYPGVAPALDDVLGSGSGVVQLPCPEAGFLGMKRWAASYEQYDTAAYRRHCRAILEPVVDQLGEFDDAGYVIERAIGVRGSPSCGVNETSAGLEGGLISRACSSRRAPGSGILIEELQIMLRERGMEVAFSDVDISRSSANDGEGSAQRGE